MDRKWWTLIAVCIGTFMLLIDVTIVNVALPDIQTSLKSTFSDLQWVVDAYSLMLAAFLLTTGSLADLFGRRRVFAIGLCIFTASSLLSGVATTPLFLNLARGAQGIGAAAMFSTSLALLASSFRGRERGMAFGVWGTITGLAVAIGPVVGGALTTGFGWRWIFLVNVPIGVVGVIVTLLRVEESRQPGARRPDWLGAVTFSGALAALVYALIQGESKGWTSNEILGCLVGAGILLLAFLIVELVQAAPMFDLSLFRNPTFAGGSLVAFSLSAGMFALLLYLTLYLQDVLGFSALETGERLLFLSGGILLTSTLAGRLTTRVPIRLLIGPGLILVGGGLLLMRGLDAASDWQHLIPGFIVGGAGVGLINPPLASTAVGVVEPARAGMASGINSTFRQVGIATGIAGLGAVFSHSVRTKMLALLAGGSVLPTAQAHAIAAGVAQGSGVGAAIAAAPPASRSTVAEVVRISFVGGLNEIFLIAAILSFAAALLSLILIRNKDFEASAAYQAAAPPAAGPPPVEAAGLAGVQASEHAVPESPGAESPGDLASLGSVEGAVVPAGPGVGEQAPDAVVASGEAAVGESAQDAVGDASRDAALEPPDGEQAVESTGEPERSGQADGPPRDWLDAEPAAATAEPALATAEPAVATAEPAEVAAAGAHAAMPESPPDPGRGDEAAFAFAAADARPPEDDAEYRHPAMPGETPARLRGSGGDASAAEGSVPVSDDAPPPGGGVPAAPLAQALPGLSREAGPPSNGARTPTPITPGNGRADQLASEASVAALAQRSYAVALAAEQAQADCSSYIEQLLARHHEATRAGQPDDDAADRAGELRDRLNDLAEQRRRFVGILRDHTQAVSAHLRAAREHRELSDRRAEDAADARRDLYGLIAALSRLTDEARVEATSMPADPGRGRHAAGADVPPND